MVSKAMKEERTAMSDIDDARRALSRVSGKLRKDSHATILIGQLSAVHIVLDEVEKSIDRRTDEVEQAEFDAAERRSAR